MKSVPVPQLLPYQQTFFDQLTAGRRAVLFEAGRRGGRTLATELHRIASGAPE